MKNSTQQKTFWVIRLISMTLIIAFLFSDATVLSAAVPGIRNFISDTISKISFEKTVAEETASAVKSTVETQSSGTVTDAGSSSATVKEPEGSAERVVIPPQIFTLLLKLYDYDNFTEKETEALYDYLGLDYSKKTENSEEFNKLLKALFDSLPETTKNEIKLNEIIYKNKHDVFSKCTDEEKQIVYDYINADITKTNKIDTIMNKLEKAGYKLFNSTLILKTMAEGVFSYEEAVELFTTYTKRPERDALVRSVKSIAKFFDIDNIGENNLTTNDIYESVKTARNNAEKSAKRDGYSKYTNNEAFTLAKKLVLQGYTQKNILVAFTVAAALGVNPEDIIINDTQAKELSAKNLSKAEKEFLDSQPVNIYAVKERIKDKKVSSKAEVTEVDDNDLSSLLEESLDLGVMLYSTSSSGESENIEAPFKLNINDNESVSLNTGSVNYSEFLVNIPGINGFDLNFSIDYSTSDSYFDEPSYYCCSGWANDATEWYIDIYYVTRHEPSGEYQWDYYDRETFYHPDDFDQWQLDHEYMTEEVYIGGGLYASYEFYTSDCPAPVYCTRSNVSN